MQNAHEANVQPQPRVKKPNPRVRLNHLSTTLLQWLSFGCALSGTIKPKPLLASNHLRRRPPSERDVALGYKC